MSSTSTASLFTPLTFTGVSAYSSDFQAIADRAVSIAAIPLQQAQNQQSDIASKKQLLTSLSSAVASVATSLSNLAQTGGSQGISGTSSDTSKVSIVNTTATSPASYEITDITSVASAASETSASGYADSSTATVSPSGSMELVAGSNHYSISLDSSTNSLVGLRDAINNLNAGVTATILTTSTGSTPNYLSVSSNTTGATTLQLLENPGSSQTDFLTSNNQGSDTIFKLNGAQVDQTGTTINNVIPGVTFSILAPTNSGQTVTINLASDGTSISSGLQNLVTNYNALVQQVQAQVGTSGGLLTGDFLIQQVQTDLRAITGYSGPGSSANSNSTIKSLADLGIEMSNTGQMSFNQTTFNNLSSANISDAFTFLGDATTGMGSLANQFTSLSDPAGGLIQIEESQYDQTNTRLQDQITNITNQINNMQNGLAAKLQAADTLIASLQSQQSVLTASIQSLDYTAYGVQTSQTGVSTATV